MGCCFSRATTKNQNSLKNTQPHQTSSPPKSNHEEAPPQPPEEESVKEVLSETPILKPPQVQILIPETKAQIPLVQNPSEKFKDKVPTEEVTEEVVVSQRSESCTVTESFSTATTATTTTVTEKREDEATSKPCSREPTTTTHKWNRSPSRKRPVVADANVSGGNERRIKSPARRPSPSPEKKMKNGSRLVRGRESGSVANRKVNAGPTGVRRDSGEGSGRRSRSPSCSRTVGVSSKIGVGVGRKQAPAKKSESEEVGEINDIVCNVTEKKSESEEGGEKNDIVCSEEGGEKNDIVCSEEVGEKNDIVSQVESIENPHVSMECFIFL
ncbi:unnamed protein product [Vicia faba]|uniref:Uncharacterized protein n=1 Tax=Vicia faba TaxID=3906 RepID=A0AAV1B020_VICFA|nr:unnamed protein product [Vicia faba]